MLVLLLALLMCQMLLDGQVIYANGKVFGGAEICQIWYTYLFYKSSSCSVSLLTFSKSVKALVMISYTSSYNNTYKLQSNMYGNINIKIKVCFSFL